jgi:hypothetical protein
MTGYDHEPVIRRNSLNGGKVLIPALQKSSTSVLSTLFRGVDGSGFFQLPIRLVHGASIAGGVCQREISDINVSIFYISHTSIVINFITGYITHCDVMLLLLLANILHALFI